MKNRIRASARGQSPPQIIFTSLIDFHGHDAFGLGRVEKFVDMGANSVISVRFNSGQTKSLMLKFANLSKVDI